MRKRLLVGVLVLVGVFGLGVGCSPSKPVDVADLEARKDVRALIQALERGDYTQMRAARALGRLDARQAVVPLIRCLDDPDAEDSLEVLRAREAVVLALGKIGDRRAVAPLTRLVSDPEISQWEQNSAFHALAEIGDPRSVLTVLRSARGRDFLTPDLVVMGDAAVPTLVALLQGKVAVPARALQEARWSAAAALGRTGGRADVARATSALTSGLRSERANTWMRASELIALVNRRHVGNLVRLLQREQTVRAYWGTILLGDRGTEKALVRALRTFGTPDMAENYANFGNRTLVAAARAWASAHGYWLLSPTTPYVVPGGEPESKTGWGTLK